jgi:hypothetical protein
MWSLAEVADNRTFIGTDIPDGLWRDLIGQNLVRDPMANPPVVPIDVQKNLSD